MVKYVIQANDSVLVRKKEILVKIKYILGICGFM